MQDDFTTAITYYHKVSNSYPTFPVPMSINLSVTWFFIWLSLFSRLVLPLRLYHVNLCMNIFKIYYHFYLRNVRVVFVFTNHTVHKKLGIVAEAGWSVLYWNVKLGFNRWKQKLRWISPWIPMNLPALFHLCYIYIYM